MITAVPAFLRKLDISWNELLEKQVARLFNALSKNTGLENLNLAMTSVPIPVTVPKSKKKVIDTTNGLRKFIRNNSRLVHLDLSGMFKSVYHVRKIIKAIKKSKTLLAVHLSHTPVIDSNLKLQTYIRKKL